MEPQRPLQNHNHPSSSEQLSVQSLQEQLSGISLSHSDPASLFPNLPHPPTSSSSTPNPDHLIHHHLDAEINRLRHLIAARTPETLLNNLPGSPFYPPYRNQHNINLPGSGSGTGSSSGSTPLGPRNGLPSNFLDDIELTRSLQYYNHLNSSNYNNYLDNGNYYTGLDARLYNNNLISNGYYHPNIDGHGNGHRQANYINFSRTLINNTRNRGYNGGSNGGNTSPNSVDDQPIFSSDSLRGRVVMFVKDKNLSQFLLKNFEAGCMRGIQIVAAEIRENIVEVLCHQSGSQFFQKFLKYLDYHHVHELLRAIMDNVDICFDNQGTRAAQEILKHVDKNNWEVKSIIVSVIRDVFRYANGCQNAYHFIEAVFNAFLQVYEVVQPLMREAADICVAIATDRVGCCKLQQIIGYGQGPERSRIINTVITHAVELSEDAFGNYVVSFIATREKEPHLNNQVVNRLQGYFVDLSKDKFGSHVVQKILAATDDEKAEIIIGEICDPAVFLDMCQHCYGNFVVQTALNKAKEMLVNSGSSTYHYLVNQVQADYPYLHSHMYGRRVLLALNN